MSGDMFLKCWKSGTCFLAGEVITYWLFKMYTIKQVGVLKKGLN